MQSKNTPQPIEFAFPAALAKALPDYKATASYWVSQLSLLESIMLPGMRGIESVKAPMVFTASASHTFMKVITDNDLRVAAQRKKAAEASKSKSFIPEEAGIDDGKKRKKEKSFWFRASFVFF